MDLQRGMRDKLDKYLDLNNKIEVEMGISGPAVYDFCCFGVDAADQLSDDRYMVFFNQTSSPAGEISYRSSGSTANFDIELSRLPQSIQKLVFTVSIDGNSTMGQISGHTFFIKQNGKEAFLELKKNNYNIKLEQFVTGADQQRLLDIIDNHIVPRTAFVYLTPKSKIGRAPFYSSEKLLGSSRIKTLWFNLGVMLCMSIVAIVLLLTDCPGKYMREQQT